MNSTGVTAVTFCESLAPAVLELRDTIGSARFSVEMSFRITNLESQSVGEHQK